IASTFPTAATVSGTSVETAATARTGTACIIIMAMGFMAGCFLPQEASTNAERIRKLSVDFRDTFATQDLQGLFLCSHRSGTVCLIFVPGTRHSHPVSTKRIGERFPGVRSLGRRHAILRIS